MGTVTAVGLFLLAIILFLLIKLKVFSNDTIQALVSAAAIVAAIAAILVFLVPAATQHPPEKAGTALPSAISTTYNEDTNMVLVPGGDFLMGSTSFDEAAADDERPQHSIYLDSYWIDRTEVTNVMYAACVDKGICQPPSYNKSRSQSDYFGNPLFNNFPVIYVNWQDADTYCRWGGKRLPTEAEWEKAARGTDGNIYPWGNTTPDPNQLNFDGKFGDTAEVGRFPSGASIYGALDMLGNVEEWVADWYDKSYYGNSPQKNPVGPISGQFRVTRGGEWGYPSWAYIRVADRFRTAPATAKDSLGFRCALSQ